MDIEIGSNVYRNSDGTIDIDFAHVVENPLINGVEILLLDPA